jgi:hypothetical protein
MGEEEQLLVDAVLRYFYYIEMGIREDKAIGPFREEWAANVLSLIPMSPPPGVSQRFYDLLLHSSLEEMHSEYVSAMKKAIVNYIVK